MRLVASRRRGPRNHRRPIARVRYSLGQQKNMLPLRKAKAFSCLFLQSKLTAFGFAMEMVKRLVRQKKTFPHVVSTPREVGESHHHEFGIWSVSVLHASTATASQHLAERRAVDRAERIYDGRHRPDAGRSASVVGKLQRRVKRWTLTERPVL